MAPGASSDLYSILGVERTASSSQITKAYRKLARAVHPDKPGGDAEKFKRRRSAEIKNGRVAMFACMGYIVPEYFRFPGYLSPSGKVAFTDIPNGLAALNKVSATGWTQMVIFLQRNVWQMLASKTFCKKSLM